MPNIELNLSKKLFTPKAYPYIFSYDHRYECGMGSAGSSKSYSITQKIIIRCCREPGIRVMVCRKFGSTIRQTVFELFKDILKYWKLTSYVKINESDFRIIFPNGSEIFFTGLDSEEKLLSLSNVSTIFIEEAGEISKDMFEQLDLRMRGKQQNQQIIMAGNPISSHHWLYDFVNNPPESFLFIHSTYKDNPFLDEPYIKSIEDLQTRNPQKWRVYGLGEWGIDTDGLVLTNWQEHQLDQTELAKLYEHRAGMDFGYQDPSAIVDTYYDAKTKTIYIVNEFYKSGQTLDELKKAIENMHLTKCKIQADSAEPRTIDYFRKQGLYVVPCIKGANSVDARIAFLQNSSIMVDPRCKNVIMELSNFSYEKDRKTGKFIDDRYTHEYSHSIDALGYRYSDIYTKSKLKTIDKSVLGLIN